MLQDMQGHIPKVVALEGFSNAINTSPRPISSNVHQLKLYTHMVAGLTPEP